MKEEPIDGIDYLPLFSTDGETAVGTGVSIFEKPPDEDSILRLMRDCIESMWEAGEKVTLFILQQHIYRNVETKAIISRALKSLPDKEFLKLLTRYETVKFIFTNKQITYIDASFDIVHCWFDNSNYWSKDDIVQAYSSDGIKVKNRHLLRTKIKRLFKKKYRIKEEN